MVFYKWPSESAPWTCQVLLWIPSFTRGADTNYSHYSVVIIIIKIRSYELYMQSGVYGGTDNLL